MFQSKEKAQTIDNERVVKLKATFRTKITNFIVSVLNPYRSLGKITSSEDFKFLARKVRV